LANEKTPLRDTTPTTPERVQKNVERSTVARRRVIAGIVVALVVIGGLWFLFGRGKDSVIPIRSPGGPHVPFKTVVPKYEAIAPTSTRRSSRRPRSTPRRRSARRHAVPAGRLREPDGWGDAGSIDGFFTDDAKQQVDANIDTSRSARTRPTRRHVHASKKGNTSR
jgi:hypothetical protein